METSKTEFKIAVREALSLFDTITEAESRIQAAPGDWSPKEVLGHLIDSATQNHRRFIELYGQDHLEFPPYNQEHWVEIQHYQSRLWDELVLCWKVYNLHLEHLLDAISEPEVLRLRHPHNLDRFTTPIASTEAEVRLTDLDGHYLNHIKLHLKQIRAAKLIWKRLIAPKGCPRSLRLPANCFFLHTLKANR